MFLRLTEKEQLIDNVWAFRFTPSEPLTWIAGQYVYVELPHDEADEEGTRRWFTISSAPYEGIIQITTRITDSTFKQALSALEQGGELQLIDPPEGDFTWQDSDRPLVFVAGGIGITPFRSILKQRIHDQLPITTVRLVYGGRTAELPFKDELAQWTEHGLHVDYVIGDPLTAEKLAETVPQLNDSLVYISGPEPMVQALGKDLVVHGLPADQCKHDEFPNYNKNNY